MTVQAVVYVVSLFNGGMPNSSLLSLGRLVGDAQSALGGWSC